MRVLVSTTPPLPSAKAEAVAKRLAEFLGVEESDIFLLPPGMAAQVIEGGAPKKAARPAEAKPAEPGAVPVAVAHPAHGHPRDKK